MAKEIPAVIGGLSQISIAAAISKINQERERIQKKIRNS